MSKTDKRGIAILGSTGSIGVQALEVIKANEQYFQVEVLSAQNNADLLIEQTLQFQPNAVVIGNEDKYEYVKQAVSNLDTKVYAGAAALASVVEMDSIDLVLTAIVGFAGLRPTINAIKSRKHIALANKETLVVAGDLVTKLAYENKVMILPVDSEHSAIFQCLIGEEANPIEKIYLTCSGGPFRGKNLEYLAGVKREHALKHPNWEMGAKITIDSSTLMNKGLEVIEAKHLFGLEDDQIDVIVHPQSIIHSIAQFEDGSMKAQMGLPDMKLPIQYALSFPVRLPTDFPRFNFLDYPELTFEQPDTNTFRNLALAYEAMKKGGNMPCVLNAANEVAVQAFLKDEIEFLEIPQLVERSLNTIEYITNPSFDDYFESDAETRNQLNAFIN